MRLKILPTLLPRGVSLLLLAVAQVATAGEAFQLSAIFQSNMVMPLTGSTYGNTYGGSEAKAALKATAQVRFRLLSGNRPCPSRRADRHPAIGQELPAAVAVDAG